jgi:hypothetical protein
MFRSILAVLAGIVTLTVTSFAIEAIADPLLMHLFPQALPDRTALMHNLGANIFLGIYTSVCVALGGYVTAWIARRAPVGHAFAMGILESILTFFAMLKFRGLQPTELWVMTMILVIPVAALGGFLYARRSARLNPSVART